MPCQAIQTPCIELIAVEQQDLEDLIAIRIDAMRESLEQVGRFDSVRVRERFANGFEPGCTRYIQVDGKRAGFVVLKPGHDAWLLDHLYISPNAQGSGVGSAVLALIFKEVDRLAMPLRVGALKHSASNRFYIRHGFQWVESGQFDNYYVRPGALSTG